MRAAAVSSDDLDQQRQIYDSAGGKVTQLPPGKKPSGKTLEFPLSGGRSHQVHSYPTARERSPLTKLLMLSPKSGGIQITGGGKGIAFLTWEDVSAALAAKSPTRFMWNGTSMQVEDEKLSKQAYQYARARYIEDPAALDDVRWNAWMAAVDLANKHSWKAPTGKDTLRNAALIALGNVMGLPSLTHCDKCNGSGNNQKGPCKRCEGTGKNAPSYRKLTRLLGAKDDKNVKAVWAPRIQLIETVIRRWERDVINHLYFQFARDQEE